jgi:hypothetical protein
VVQVESLEEARLHLASQLVRIEELERIVSDHAQRFDTLQTVPPKRLLFWLQGWPLWTDLNADRPRWRPWRSR